MGVFMRHHLGLAFGIINVVFVAGMVSLPAQAQTGQCAEARVASGTECENLYVRFDLSKCEDPDKTSLPTRNCSRDAGEFVLKTAKAKYAFKVQRGTDGAWSVSALTNASVSPKKQARQVAAAPTPTPAAGSPSSGESQSPTAAITPTSPVPTPPPVAPVAPPPATPTLISVSGSLRARHEFSEKTDLATSRSFTLLRARTEVTFKVTPEVLVFLQPQFSRTLGEVSYVPSSATGNTATELSGTAVDPAFSAHQAYAIYKAPGAIDITLGRQVLSYGNEVIVGPLDWNNVGRTFEGVKARKTHGLGWTDLFFSKIRDTNTTTAGAGDKDFAGLYNGFTFGETLRALDLYVFELRDSTVDPVNRLWTYGARAQSSIGAFDYKLEGTQQDGSTTGQQGILELGYTFDSKAKPRISAHGFFASEKYNPLYPTGHAYLGYADVFGRRNINGYWLQAKANVTESLMAQVDYHRFWRTTVNAAPYKVNGTTAIGAAAASSSKELAQEIDLTLRYQIDKHVSVTGGAAYVLPGQYLKAITQDKYDPQHYYLSTEVKF